MALILENFYILQFTCLKQECIPVGYVPSAAVAVWRGGRYLCLGVYLALGVPVGGCTWPQGGYLPRGDVPGPGGVPTQVLPPVNRMTDRCKNISFATSLRTVIIKLCQVKT